MTTPDDGATPVVDGLLALAAAVDAAPSPLRRLAALRDLEDAVAADEAATVAAARARNESWAAVGKGLRRSKQAVARKYGTPAGRSRTDVDTTNGATPVKEPRRAAGWDVQTPRGWTLLRITKRR